MNLRLPMFLISCFTFSNALAAACDVYTHSQSEQVPVVEQHTCYTYEGVPADAIDWSCSNENKDMMNTKNQDRSMRWRLYGQLQGNTHTGGTCESSCNRQSSWPRGRDASQQRWGGDLSLRRTGP